MPLPALLALPTEVLSLVLAQLCLVRNIKGVKRTSPAHSRPELWRLP